MVNAEYVAGNTESGLRLKQVEMGSRLWMRFCGGGWIGEKELQ